MRSMRPRRSPRPSPSASRKHCTGRQYTTAFFHQTSLVAFLRTRAAYPSFPQPERAVVLTGRRADVELRDRHAVRGDERARTGTLRHMSSTLGAGLYELPPEFVEFRDAIRQIVQERVAPRAAEIDATAEYPWDLRRLFAEHDLFGLPFSEEHGGTGTGTLMLNIAVEEVSKACASTALMLMIQELGTLPIRLFGSDELKDRFMPRCATGEWTPAFALSEPDAGSDPGGMRTRAV